MKKRNIYNPRLKRFEVACRKPDRRVITWQENARDARRACEEKGLEVVWVQAKPIETERLG